MLVFTKIAKMPGCSERICEGACVNSGAPSLGTTDCKNSLKHSSFRVDKNQYRGPRPPLVIGKGTGQTLISLKQGTFFSPKLQSIPLPICACCPVLLLFASQLPEHTTSSVLKDSSALALVQPLQEPLEERWRWIVKVVTGKIISK